MTVIVLGQSLVLTRAVSGSDPLSEALAFELIDILVHRGDVVGIREAFGELTKSFRHLLWRGVRKVIHQRSLQDPEAEVINLN